MVHLADTLTIDSSQRTADGFMKVIARGARSGIQKYLGREVDPTGKTFKADQIVNVYRPPAEVFDKASLASSVGRPITDDHPSVPVTAENWRDHSRGAIGGAVKDGEWVRFDLAFMDAALIKKIDDGKKQLSGGYACDLSFETGTTDSGETFDAVQRNIRFNHLAVVDAARAGPDARIGDEAISDGGNDWSPCDAIPQIIDALTRKRPMNFIMLDGLKVDLDDGDAVKIAVTKLQTAKDEAITAKDAAVAQTVADAATIVAKDAEITALTAKLADAAITPAKLADAAKEYADAQAKAKVLGVQFAADADTAAIKKAVVDAKMGDKAKDYPAEHIAIAFDSLTAGVKTDDATQQHQVITAPIALGDAATKEHAAWQQANDHNSWRTAGTAAN